MNIQNRLKKLEIETTEADAKFCDCFETFQRKVVDLVYSGADYTDADCEKLGENVSDGDFCKSCEKPVSFDTIKAKNDLVEMWGGI